LTHPLHYWRQKNRYYHEDLERLHRFFVPPGLRILEIGSGTGSLLNALQPSFGVGIDWDAEIVAQAQRQFPHLHFRVQDAHTLDKQDPILAEPFDVILLVNTLGYLADVQQVLERLRRFCTPRTRLILSYHNPLWEPLLSLATVLKQRMPLPAANWLSAGDVANLLHLAGYEVIQQGKRLLLPRRIPLLSTLINRFIAPLPGINAILSFLAISRKLNGQDLEKAFPVADEIPLSEIPELIGQLELKMKAAAKNLEFEEAAQLRDQIKKLRQRLLGHHQST
jgi:hypothetical protein